MVLKMKSKFLLYKYESDICIYNLVKEVVLKDLNAVIVCKNQFFLFTESRFYQRYSYKMEPTLE